MREGEPGSVTSRYAPCTPDDVWAVLADGWSLASWVVGAARIRSVDAGWPATGTRVHHSVGTWPALIDDSTTVRASEPGRRLLLQARAWPTGEATVDITLAPEGDGCRITMSEDASAGPARLIPAAVRRALLDARNREALRRLALIAEGRRRREA